MDADRDSFYYNSTLTHTLSLGVLCCWKHNLVAPAFSPCAITNMIFFLFPEMLPKNNVFFFYSYLIIEYFLIENALNNWKTYLTKKAFYSSLWLQNPSAKQHRSELNLGQLMWQLMKWICSLWCSLLERYHCSYRDLAVRVGCGEPQWKRHRLHCVSCPMLHDTHSGTDQFQ